MTIELNTNYTQLKSNDATGEKALWQSVIMQAIFDAASTPNNTQGKIDRLNARKWFSLENEDFITVCVYAGFDPQTVINGAKSFVTKNRQSTLLGLPKKRINRLSKRTKPNNRRIPA